MAKTKKKAVVEKKEAVQPEAVEPEVKPDSVEDLEVQETDEVAPVVETEPEVKKPEVKKATGEKPAEVEIDGNTYFRRGKDIFKKHADGDKPVKNKSKLEQLEKLL
jgi:hypothetical protein